MLNEYHKHYAAGNLALAIAAAEEAIKQSPNDIEARSFLVELLCITGTTGDLQRANRLLELLKHQHPEAMLGIILLRQLIRAAEWRCNCFVAGLPPKFLGGAATADIQSRLQTLVELRANHCETATQILRSVEAAYKPLSGTCNGNSFTLFRDMDDICAYTFEVFTSKGEYYWLPMERIKALRFKPAKRPLDLLWRAASLETFDDLAEDVYIPITYYAFDEVHLHDEKLSDALKLSQQTIWREIQGQEEGAGIVRGLGQKMFMVGDDVVPILAIEELHFEELCHDKINP